MSNLALRFRGLPIAVVVLGLSAGLALAGGGLPFPDAGSGGVTADDDGAADHGDLVSQAAQMETPDGFKNHGAFVSCVARALYKDDDADAEPAEEVVLAELTPEDCERDAEAEAEPDEDEADEAATEDEDEWDNHGDLVSDAAQMATPDGFKNHGAFVSCVAKMSYGKKGSEAPAEFTLAGLTTEDCDQAEDDAAATADEDSDKPGKGKGHGKGKGKGHGRGRGG